MVPKMKGRPEKIDVLKLYAKSDAKAWNAFLSKCLQTKDLHSLEKVLYGIQLGMNDLAKKKLNTEKINMFFIRIQKSLENTIRDVIRTRIPNALDDPLNVGKFGQMKDSKQKRDQDIERHLRKVRF